jgi:hypothetical protein
VVWFRDDSRWTVERFGDHLTSRRRRNRILFGAWGYFVSEVPGDADPCTDDPFYAGLRPGVGMTGGMQR